MSFELIDAGGMPVLFLHHFTFFTFLLILIDCVCMAAVYAKKRARYGCPVRLFVHSTIVFLLHMTICGFAFQYSMLFETVPSRNLLAQIGTYTWLLVTPALYLVTAVLFLVLCIYLVLERKKRL